MSSSSFPKIVKDNGRAYGWIPDAPDSRDKHYSHLLRQQVSDDDLKEYQQQVITKKLSAFVEQDPKDPLPIYDQFQLRSCVSNAVAVALRFAWKQGQANKNSDKAKATYSSFDPSRLWIYYYSRTKDYNNKRKDFTKYNYGASIRDSINLVHKIGVCQEKFHRYPSLEKTSEAVAEVIDGKETRMRIFPPELKNPATIEPNQQAKDDAATFHDLRWFEYYRIVDHTDDNTPSGGVRLNEVQQMRACIAEGYPVIFGFNIYSNTPFGDWSQEEYPGVRNPWDKDQFMEFPQQPGSLVSGHAVLAVGFDESRKAFLCQNSWGVEDDWKGEKPSKEFVGKFWMPYSWFKATDKTGPVRDVWMIRPKGAKVGPLRR
ncbi:hypothetical protein QBC43DRAFT_337583 [Cladorrhinum sp. PSN259]|nr:hypothetical protein QBC43DRAFT_337583 [Cladorrhinum sp. PSN259]